MRYLLFFLIATSGQSSFSQIEDLKPSCSQALFSYMAERPSSPDAAQAQVAKTKTHFAPALITGRAIPVVLSVIAFTDPKASSKTKNTHPNRLLAIYDGAASTGNNATQELWIMVNKKHKEAFKDMSYKEFLKSIDEANTSGDACVLKKAPNKEDVLEIVYTDSDDEDSSVVSEAGGSKVSR